MTPASIPTDFNVQEELSPGALTAIVRELMHREDEMAAEIAELRQKLLPAAAQSPPVVKPLPPVTKTGIGEKYSNYQQLIDRVRQIVAQSVPPSSTIAVVRKGDDALLKLEGLNAWHFPQRDAQLPNADRSFRNTRPFWHHFALGFGRAGRRRTLPESRPLRLPLLQN